MKIAVLGAGFCGIAVTWNLIKSKKGAVTLFDPNGIGGGASGIAAGLLHPFAGLHSKLNWNGYEGMAATRELIDIAEKQLGSFVAERKGIFRPAIIERQLDDFKLCAQSYPEDVEWLGQDKVEELFPGIPARPGLFIRAGMEVDCRKYLEGLWKACEAIGAQFKKEGKYGLDELEDYDVVVACLGAGTKSFRGLEDLRLGHVKGQILEIEMGAEPLLPCPLVSQVYLSSMRGIWIGGATFERGYASDLPDKEVAMNLLWDKLVEVYPPLKNGSVKNVKAGVRVVAPNHLPSLVKVNDRLISLTGMGSKGLLWHGIMAAKAANEVY